MSTCNKPPRASLGSAADVNAVMNNIKIAGWVMERSATLAVAILLWAVAFPASGFAQTKAPDLIHASIEDLMNIEITSVAHKEQRAGDAAAAVYVVTQEEIRRSGMTTVPELLRLVPGMQVAQINSNKWAVAVRGFNNLFAGKVLVLIDGRTMYDRLNSGVFWESLDVPLDLIDRIEVIRGPGGATWGANAVNGVINIITKSAGATAGASATVRAGTFEGTHAAARYGGRLGSVAYRLDSQWSGRGESQIDADTHADDNWRSQTHGVRLDWNRAADTLMAQAGVTRASVRGLFHGPSGPVPAVKPPFPEETDTHEYHVLGRWTHRRNDRSSLDVQSFVNFRQNLDSVNPRQLLADIDARYHTSVGGRHDVVIGGGYRFLDEKTDGSFNFSIAPKNASESVVNAFAQDEIALGTQVHLTLGAKVERDTYAGWGIQPTARVMWSIVPKRHGVWAAVSRALRTPNLGDVSGRYNFTSFIGQGGLPVVVGALGNTAYETEEVVNTEAGYRLELGALASVDVTAFVATYDKLKTSEPLAPRMEPAPGPPHLFIPVQFGNLLEATTRGIEITARWNPASWWRLEGGYSTFHLTPHLSPASRDVAAASFDGNAPAAQWQARSTFFLPHRVEVNAMVFHAGKLARLDVAAYTRADARLEVPLTPRLSVALVGQNLFDDLHAEYAGAGAIVTPTLIPRNASVSLVWRP
jgi:iron complex outermembrane recepter protein